MISNARFQSPPQDDATQKPRGNISKERGRRVRGRAYDQHGSALQIETPLLNPAVDSIKKGKQGSNPGPCAGCCVTPETLCFSCLEV
jgi:hypothetical protein